MISIPRLFAIALLFLGANSELLAAGETTFVGGVPPVEPPGPFAGDVFGAVAVGEFTGDLGVDAVVLASGVPTLCISIETLKTSIRWSGGVARDLIAVPTETGPDRLFVVAATGLHELTWGGVSQAWETEDIDISAWASARALSSGDLDGDGAIDLVGLADEGQDDRRVLLSYGDAGGGFGVSPFAFQTMFPARDVTTLDWDGDGTCEIVARTDGGVELYEEHGVLVGFEPIVDPTMMMTVIDEPTSAAQRLALVLRVQSMGPQLLVLVGADGLEGPTPLGSIGVVSLSGADMDGDGDTDLLFGLNSSTHIGRLETHSDFEQADPSDATFDSGEVVLVPFGPQNRDPSINGAGLAAIDVDHDGVMEVFAPAQCSDGLVPGAEPPYSDIFVVDENTAEEIDARVGLSVVSSTLAQSVIYPLLTLEGPAAPLTAGAGEELQLQITLWRGTDFWEPTAEHPVFAGEFPLPAPGAEVDIVVPYVDVDPNPNVMFGWVIRQVVTNAGGVVARGPATTGVQAFGENAGMLGLLGASEVIMQVVPLAGGTSTPDAAVTVGTTIPRFDDDRVPAPSS